MDDKIIRDIRHIQSEFLAYKAVIGALVATHPNPEALRELIEKLAQIPRDVRLDQADVGKPMDRAYENVINSMLGGIPKSWADQNLKPPQKE